jgi:hypothetical protein
MLLALFVDRRFDGQTRPEVSRHKTAGGEENERNPQRPRSVQQRLRLKGKSKRGRRKDAVLLLSHNLSAGALGTGDAAGPASICSWGATCQGSAKPNQHRLVLCTPTWPLLPLLASESRADWETGRRCQLAIEGWH